MVNPTPEELREIRNRVNTSKQKETENFSKVGLADDYVVTDTKLRKENLCFERELARINKEFLEL